MIEFLNRMTEKFAEENKDYTRFLVISGPRSGSSYLSSLLRSHPDIISYSELFHPRRVVLGPDHKQVDPDTLLTYRINHPVEFINTIYDTTYSKNIAAVGFKLLYRQAGNPAEKPAWDWLIGHDDIRVIHLTRDDLLAQYLSIRQARVRGQYTTQEHSTDGPLRIALPEDECLRMFRQTSASRNATRTHFQPHPYLEISYEQLHTETENVTNTVLDFLDVTRSKLTSELVKMNPWSPRECICNYAELKRYFQNTEWRRFFD